MPYHSRSAGLLTGGGSRRSKVRMRVISNKPLKNIPDVHISDIQAVKREIPDFDPALEFEYTRRELMLLTEKMLLTDPKLPNQDPVWITAERYVHRIRPREIFTSSGTPDPAIASGIYWRSHPDGRRINSDEQRKLNNASYYR